MPSAVDNVMLQFHPRIYPHMDESAVRKIECSNQSELVLKDLKDYSSLMHTNAVR